jgi:superoxide reductase
MKIYINKENGKTIISKDELCINGYEELIASSTDAAKEKHVPVVTKKCKQVKVDVGSVSHPMTAEHLIEWVAIETEKGYQVKYLTANDAPVCSFSLADGDTFVRAYAYCNLHGVWSN